MSETILYLSAGAIAACNLSPGDVNGIIESSFAAKASGNAAAAPGMTIALPGGDRFIAKGGTSQGHVYAAVKWFAIKPELRMRGATDHFPLLLLSDVGTGRPVAVMEASWITATRTASISAVAARHLARKTARHIGFVACGNQARSHLEALRAIFPIESVVGFSRRRETAERFIAEVKEAGLSGALALEPRQAVAEADIVVTTVPSDSEPNGFLRGEWLAPGAFVAMVDRGFSWHQDAFSAFDRIFTDDLALSGPKGSEHIKFSGSLAGDLGDIVSRAVSGRQSDVEITALAFSGSGLADAAVAAVLYERAREKNLGTLLPL